MSAVVKRILAMTGLQNDVRVVIDPSTKTCAYATTVSGRQYIGVDLDCVGPLRTGERYNWRALGILTHELGHLLGGHTTNSTSSHQEESEADAWAGWAMYRLGATLAEAQTVFATFSVSASKTHPARAVRLASVARGWERARAGTTPLRKSPPHKNRWREFLSRPVPWVLAD